MSCRDLEVAALNVSRTQPIPYLRRPVSIPLASNSLTSPDPPDFWVLERREDPWHQSRWPGDIIICHNCDGRLNLGKRLAHLDALIGDRCSKNPNLGVLERLGQALEGGSPVVSSDQNELRGLAGQDAHQRWSEFLNSIVNGRDDDCNVLVGESWLGWDGFRLVSPVADAVDQQSEVAMNP